MDVIVRQGASILKLLSREDQSLLVWWNAFFILNLGLDIVDRVGRLNLKSDGLASQGLDEAVSDVSFQSFAVSLQGFVLTSALD